MIKISLTKTGNSTVAGTTKTGVTLPTANGQVTQGGRRRPLGNHLDGR
ncbi:hypothetical protein [Geobacter metallireducens]|nr:hypothetical protein [Geobacter metallireducens]